jgi:hypothetical protein
MSAVVEFRLTLILGIALWTGACANKGGSMVGPSDPSTPGAQPGTTSTPLTVCVRTRGAEQPIAGATVFQDDRVAGQTDAAGIVRTIVPLAVDFHIRVSAPGFVGEGAWGSVANEERWTFYLAPDPG